VPAGGRPSAGTPGTPSADGTSGAGRGGGPAVGSELIGTPRRKGGAGCGRAPLVGRARPGHRTGRR
jgi:hypothetical protein